MCLCGVDNGERPVRHALERAGRARGDELFRAHAAHAEDREEARVRGAARGERAAPAEEAGEVARGQARVPLRDRGGGRVLDQIQLGDGEAARDILRHIREGCEKDQGGGAGGGVRVVKTSSFSSIVSLQLLYAPPLWPFERGCRTILCPLEFL